MRLTESTVEDAALSLFGKLGYAHHYGSYMAHSGPAAGLIQISVPNASRHIWNVFAARDLRADSVVKGFLTTAADGKTNTHWLTFVTQGTCA